MIVTIQVSQDVEIPDEHLLALADKVRAKWLLPEGQPVPVEDLILQASADGLVDLPERWRTDEDVVTDEELKTLAGSMPAKKKRKKS